MERTLAMLFMMAVQFFSGPGKVDRELQDELRQLNAQEVEALLRSDTKTLSRLWSDDFVVTNPLSKFVNKRQVVELIESKFLVMTFFERQVEYIRVYGGTAVIAGEEKVVWAGKMPAAGKLSHLRFTAVWMKQQGRWQQIARHANTVE